MEKRERAKPVELVELHDLSDLQEELKAYIDAQVAAMLKELLAQIREAVRQGEIAEWLQDRALTN